MELKEMTKTMNEIKGVVTSIRENFLECELMFENFPINIYLERKHFPDDTHTGYCFTLLYEKFQNMYKIKIVPRKPEFTEKMIEENNQIYDLLK